MGQLKLAAQMLKEQAQQQITGSMSETVSIGSPTHTEEEVDVTSDREDRATTIPGTENGAEVVQAAEESQIDYSVSDHTSGSAVAEAAIIGYKFSARSLDDAVV